MGPFMTVFVDMKHISADNLGSSLRWDGVFNFVEVNSRASKLSTSFQVSTECCHQKSDTIFLMPMPYKAQV